MTQEQVRLWVAKYPLSAQHIDCTTAVMLKILDGKCKMLPAEKQVMSWLYDCIKQQPSELLGNEIHKLIAESRDDLDESQRMLIYEKRVLAESMISRPVMKAFKALIREQGLFESVPPITVSENEMTT